MDITFLQQFQKDLAKAKTGLSGFIAEINQKDQRLSEIKKRLDYEIGKEKDAIRTKKDAKPEEISTENNNLDREADKLRDETRQINYELSKFEEVKRDIQRELQEWKAILDTIKRMD